MITQDIVSNKSMMQQDVSTTTFGDKTLIAGDTKYDWEPLDKHYFECLKAFLIDTFEKCTYHRQRFQSEGHDIYAIDSFEDFEKLPFLGPLDVGSTPESYMLPDSYREKLRKGLSDLPPNERMVKKFTTTGSSGMGRKVTYYTGTDWDMLTADMLRHFQHVPPEEISLVMHAFQPAHSCGRMFEDGLHRFGSSVEFKHFANRTDESVLEQMKIAVEELGGFNCLSAPPCLPPGLKIKKGGTLDALLDADKDNFIGKNIRTIITAGAPRDLPEFRLMDRVWEANEKAQVAKTNFVDIYGCAEVGPAATECQCNNGFHLIQGHIYTEVVDPKTRKHVKNGERGLVLHTGLRHGSRYIRYVVGDEATFVTDPCPCGRTSPRIKDVVRVLEKDRLMEGCAGVWDIESKSDEDSKAHAFAKSSMEDRMVLIEEELQDFVLGKLKNTKSNEVDWDLSFEELGLDSFGMMDIANFINDTLGITFAPMLMFSYGHCETLANYLSEEIERQYSKN